MDKIKQQSYNRAFHASRKHPCPVCGIPIGWASKHCKKHRPFYKGERASNWKGGRRQTPMGYILIYKPEHPRATDNYVFEHILIWEEYNGKSLPEDWVIHHLNGIRNDNRHKNLVALPNRKHHFILTAKAKRIQELEAQLNKQIQFI